ncbi:hypothetical protein HPB51_024312 [Rhipicephalus microplus]|uniref:Uncharacterized protein n=1 Tax=Rhipicephalus microplus TaxID=6941 RepID=A0A9J6DWX2_RHIMP|nr:hypothetical protein HPB51_024312 [Rhipicephalus microplus]
MHSENSKATHFTYQKFLFSRENQGSTAGTIELTMMMLMTVKIAYGYCATHNDSKCNWLIRETHVCHEGQMTLQARAAVHKAIRRQKYICNSLQLYQQRHRRQSWPPRQKALHLVKENDGSSNAASGAPSSLFPMMFPSSATAKKMLLGKDKVGYTIVYGLAPFFKESLESKPRTICRSLGVGSRLLVVLFCLSHLIVHAGDLETNSGPNKVDQLLTFLKELASSNEKFQRDVTGRLKDMQAGITDVKRRISSLERIPKDIDILREGVAALTSALDDVKADLKSSDVPALHPVLEEVKTHLQNTGSRQFEQASIVVDNLSNRLRRNNLIFKGVPEQGGEKWDDTEKLISQFVLHNLGFNIGEIERAHRIGQQTPGKNRPIIMKFLNFKDKSTL